MDVTINDLKKWNEQMKIQFWSWTKSECFNIHVRNIHPDDYLYVLKEFSFFLFGNSKEFEVSYRLRNDHGNYTWVLAKSDIILRDHGIPMKVVGTYQDISKLKIKEEKLEKLAYRDHLTGTFNRLGIFEYMNNYEMKYKNHPSALIFFDLDNFKKINDIYGHKYGDQALKNISHNILNNLPKNYHLSRVAGDEFIIFIEDFISKEKISMFVEDLLNIIFNSNDKTLSDEAILTASVGIAIYPYDASNTSDLIRKADIAMYMAKKQGKARYVYYNNEVEESYLETTQMHRKLLDAFKNDEFGVSYQPVYDVLAKKNSYYELIPFWNHPKRGILISEDFVHTLYEEGLIINFDEWIIDRCLKDIVSMKDRGIDFKVSLNISPKHLSYSFLVDFVKRKLAQYNLKGDCLKIEMVEFILQEDFEAINQNFKELQELGCEIIIDKFAINSSTIAVLNKMNFDTIKINKYFIETLEQEFSSKIIFDTIYKIAKEHNKKFIAEGVLNQMQYDIVVKKGCQYVQGDYVQKAIPLVELIK